MTSDIRCRDWVFVTSNIEDVELVSTTNIYRQQVAYPFNSWSTCTKPWVNRIYSVSNVFIYMQSVLLLSICSGRISFNLRNAYHFWHQSLIILYPWEPTTVLNVIETLSYFLRVLFSQDCTAQPSSFLPLVVLRILLWWKDIICSHIYFLLITRRTLSTHCVVAYGSKFSNKLQKVYFEQGASNALV